MDTSIKKTLEILMKTRLFLVQGKHEKFRIELLSQTEINVLECLI